MTISEEQFLKNYQTEIYEKPSITADLLTFAVDMKQEEFKLKVLLVKRAEHPFKDKWSLPGGFMGIKETLEETAYRVAKEKTGLEVSYLEQLYTFSDVHRDPRMRILSTTYLNLISMKNTTLQRDCAWFELNVEKTGGTQIEGVTYSITAAKEGEELRAECLVRMITNPNRLEKTKIEIDVLKSDFAFDHAKMICLGFLRVQNKITYTNVAFHFMEPTFTLPALQKVYECILQREFHKTSFRNLVKPMVEKTGDKAKAEGFAKPSILYKYNGGTNYDFT